MAKPLKAFAFALRTQDGAAIRDTEARRVRRSPTYTPASLPQESAVERAARGQRNPGQ